MIRQMLSVKGAALVAAAVFGSQTIFNCGQATAAVVGNASFSGTVETSGVYPTTGLGSSFQAAGNTATANTPADIYPAYGVVAYNASSFTSLASTGVNASATLTAQEYISTSTSTGTAAGSIIDIYFSEAPTETTTGLGVYDPTYAPGGFNASNFNADLVGVTTYANVANQVDTIPLTLSIADVNYIDSVLTSGSGTFEFFAVAATGAASARYDGNYTAAPATLSLTAADSVPEPATVLLAASALTPLVLRRRRA